MTLSHNERMTRKLAKQLSDKQFTLFSELISKERKKEIRDMYGPKFKTPQYAKNTNDTMKFINNFGDLLEEQTKIEPPKPQIKKIIRAPAQIEVPKPIEIEVPRIEPQEREPEIIDRNNNKFFEVPHEEHERFEKLFEEHLNPKDDLLSKIRRRLP